MTVTAKYSNGTEKDVTDRVTTYADPLTTDDTFVTVSFDYAKYQDKTNENGANSTGAAVSAVEQTVDINVLEEDDYNKVENVKTLIDEIGTVTLDSSDKISAARTAYDELGKTLAEYVDNYETLTTAESDFEKLKQESEPSSDVSSEESSESSSEESAESSSGITDESSESVADISKNDTSSQLSKADSSSKASTQTTTNPATGFAQGGIALGVTAILGAAAIKFKNKK